MTETATLAERELGRLSRHLAWEMGQRFVFSGLSEKHGARRKKLSPAMRVALVDAIAARLRQELYLEQSLEQEA